MSNMLTNGAKFSTSKRIDSHIVCCRLTRQDSVVIYERIFRNGPFHKLKMSIESLDLGVYLSVKTCEVFLCFVAIVRVRAIVLTSLFSLFYVTGEGHRFLHRG